MAETAVVRAFKAMTVSGSDPDQSSPAIARPWTDHGRTAARPWASRLHGRSSQLVSQSTDAAARPRLGYGRAMGEPWPDHRSIKGKPA